MRKPPQAVRRLNIARLDLDLRGIAPGTAEASARALGPALASVLTRARDSGLGIWDSGGGVDRVDAGSITMPASPDPHDLAVRIAQRIAHALKREER